MSVDERPYMTLMVSLAEDKEWDALQGLSDQLTRQSGRVPFETQDLITELLGWESVKLGMVTVNNDVDEQVSN